MKKKTETFTFRIDTDTKKALIEKAEKESLKHGVDISAGQIALKAIREYLKKK